MSINKFFVSLLILFLGLNLSVSAVEASGNKDTNEADKKRVLVALQKGGLKNQ